MSFETRLANSQQQMEAHLGRLIASLGPEVPVRLTDAMRPGVLGGGKRFRPFLAIATAELLGKPAAAALDAAASVELVHCYSLIHDDLPAMDNDDIRRGAPTVHRAYDEATAILAGDALLTFAFELLAEPATHSDPQMRCKLITALAKASGAHGMVAGQSADMAGADVGSDLIAVTRMNRLKTGALINFAVDAGALIGGASEAEKTALSRYAHDVGLAFQMRDDLLDAEGVVRDTGKAVGKDKARGKVNFVTVLGADATRERIAMLAKQAKQHLSLFGSRARILLDAVDFIVDRRY